MKIAIFSLVAALSVPSALAETVKDREGAVRGDAKAMEDNSRWIYNDVAAGFAEAEKTGKPLMVVLRCVPCLACMGIDTEVLVENRDLTPLMDQFVRVRVINANALDLSLFQFDYDLSFSILFFNADRTVYGRFGSWEHQKDTQSRATSGLEQAMERVLHLHGNLEKYADGLAGKTGAPMSYKTPVDMPEMKGKYQADLDWSGQVVQSCVHCHQIGDAIRLQYRDARETVPLEWILPYPAPEAVGLVLKEDPVTAVESVLPGSVADASGFRAGDNLVMLDGQPLVSVADISWVLHRAPESGEVSAEVLREGAKVTVPLKLSEGWREQSDVSRRVGTWPMRKMAFGGMKLEDLDAKERERIKIGEEMMALEAVHVGEYGPHAAAKKAGFLKGDVLVEVDGVDARMSETELLTMHLSTRKPGEKVPAVVLRDRKRVNLMIPVQ